MFPILQGQIVQLAGDEGFERGAFLHGARVFEQLPGKLGQFLFLCVCDSLNFFSGIKLNQLTPKNCAISLTKLFDEFSRETIDDFAVFDLKRLIALFGFMAERFDDCRVELRVT